MVLQPRFNLKNMLYILLYNMLYKSSKLNGYFKMFIKVCEIIKNKQLCNFFDEYLYTYSIFMFKYK